jgi:hypothetical protein
MKNKLTIIVEQNLGIFLGNHAGIAIFSYSDATLATKAYGFRSKDDAKKYVRNYLKHMKNNVEYVVVPCPHREHYVTVVDLIKAGHADLAADLFLNMSAHPTLQ